MAEKTAFMDRAMKYFTDQGYSPQAAAALAGHGQWESSGSPTIQDPRGEGSIGLYQWRLGRRDGLNDFARARGLDPLKEDTQLAYTDWELNHTERGAGDQLRSAQSLDDANAAMMSYLRPSGWTPRDPRAGHAWPNRAALAEAALGDGQVQQGDGQARPVQPVQLAQASDVASTQMPDTASVPDRATIWDALRTDGKKMIDLGEPQVADAGPAMGIAPAPVHRGQGQPTSLINLIFQNRKNKTIRGQA